MKKSIVVFDLLFYLILPYLIWNQGRDVLGDYYAILLSSVPGFIYTIFRFVKEKQFNVTGMFILFSLFAGTAIDLLSGGAERMLWNQVFFGIFMALLIFTTILIKQPLGMHFAVDIAYIQGEPRDKTQSLYRKPEFYKYFVGLTGLFAFRSLFQAGLKSYLLMEYGAKKYDFILFAMKISGWIFGGLITAGFVFISLKIYNYHEKNKGGEGSESPIQTEPKI
ncbi:VC0807 family protein [Fictibacillus terranigra]|uniref:VC0807 family protein n=1 Tax=Fictibacillus terranigra TaxID=3058424 RepID=A0ABT8EAE0_9BACL|nr:VC0807 family protein [Fictibacillus sp. CENA-BCM004]MDN4074871.1 VC0807 family protein [Fictibacillus sp. CENA-BCM004]